jgi:hypothetical protein
VSIVAEKLPSGVSRSRLRAAFNQAALTHCYSGSVHKWQGEAPPSATLAIATNTSGRIVMAQAGGDSLPASVRECVEQVARTGSIRNGEGGEARATLILQPE